MNDLLLLDGGYGVFGNVIGGLEVIRVLDLGDIIIVVRVI